MSGYFDRLIASYGPAADNPPAQMPWMAEFAAPGPTMPDDPPLTPATPLPLHKAEAAVPAPDPAVPPPLPAADAMPAPSIAAPAPVQKTAPPAEASVPDSLAPSATPHDPAVALPDPPADRTVIIHQQDLSDTHLHVTDTHLHQHDHLTQVIAPAAFTPDEQPAPASAADVPPASTPDDLSGALAALEAQLARTLAGLHSPAPPPPSLITPADFEPEDTQLPLPATQETIREVTREIVREIHHHQDAPPAPPPRMAPQSAAAASRIGPIRFASVWDSKGRAS